jgi:hypothetical protein
VTICAIQWPELAPSSATALLTARATFAHIGLVVADMASAKHALSAGRDVRWKDAGFVTLDLVLKGQPQTLDLHIAHSIGGNPRVELIEAVPGTIWSDADETRAHHYCYWSDDDESLCRDIEKTGGKRLLGNDGGGSGYFLLPDAGIIEILSAATHRRLAAWIGG